MRSELEDWNDSIWNDSLTERAMADGKIEACREIDKTMDKIKTRGKMAEYAREELKGLEALTWETNDAEDKDFYQGKIWVYRDLLEELKAKGRIICKGITKCHYNF